MAKVKEVYHIYRSGSGASTPSCNHYGSTSKRYNPYTRYQDHYGSNRSSNGFRLLKFGDTLTERSIENELDPNDKLECNQERPDDDVEDVEDAESNELGKHCDCFKLTNNVVITQIDFKRYTLSTFLDDIFEYENLSENDKDRISRLFYLQLYSGSINPEKYKEDENYRKIIKDLYAKRNKLEVMKNS